MRILSRFVTFGAERRGGEFPEICQHESGTRAQKFDADGCGYFVWTCDACGYQEQDDMP